MRQYGILYPQRRQPSLNVCRRFDQRLRENRTPIPEYKGILPGIPRLKRTVEAEEAIIDAVAENPTISCRQVGRLLNIPFKAVNRVTRDEMLHPYHYTKVQSLLPEDYERRMAFAQWILEKDVDFLRKILWTDESLFTNGIFNRHNHHYYAINNPFLNFETGRQHRFSLNVWAGIIGNQLIGPHI